MDVEVTVKVSWQTLDTMVRPVPSIDVKLSNVEDDDAGQQITEILLEAAQGVAEAIMEATEPRLPRALGVALSDARADEPVRVALSGMVESSERFGEPLDLGGDPDRGVGVSGWVIIDGRPVQVVASRTSSPDFFAVQDAVEDVAVAFRAGDSNTGYYDETWAVALMARAKEPAEFVSRERILDYEREHEIVQDAKAILDLARHIADCEPAMRVLDTAYQRNGSGGPLGARLREIVGSGLPHFPRSIHEHPEEYPLTERREGS